MALAGRVLEQPLTTRVASELDRFLQWPLPVAGGASPGTQRQRQGRRRGMDALSLLRKDHDTIKPLLRQIMETTDRAEKRRHMEQHWIRASRTGIQQ